MDRKEITNQYKEFWKSAVEIAKKDVETYPLRKKEVFRDRMEEHLIGMLEMYSIRCGDPEQRLQMVNFLEKQLFRVPPVEDEVCHLTFDMWKELKKQLLSGEYQSE
jgi:hypothetical protein